MGTIHGHFPLRQKITFGWYMKHVSWAAFIGYLAGMGCYWLEKTLL